MIPSHLSSITLSLPTQSAETVAHGIQQGWVDASHPPLFAANGDAYFLLLPVEDGERGAFKQVVMVNASVRKKLVEYQPAKHNVCVCVCVLTGLSQTVGSCHVI